MINSEKKPVESASPILTDGRPLDGKKILIVVENLPLPFDRRVWQEARTLAEAGAVVSVICPTGRGYEKRYEYIEGIHIHRHPLPIDADNSIGYLKEYLLAFLWQTLLAWKIYLTRGFHVIQGCNPPDLIFLIALPFRPFGVRYIFDHHDINPELYEAKFGKRGVFWSLLRSLEKLTFKVATVSIATNESYRKIAITRGGMSPDRVFVVRSGPDLSRLKKVPSNSRWNNGRDYMVGYVGVMGEQEGIDLLLVAIDYIVRLKGRRDIQFCLVGSGPSLAAIKDLTAAHNLNDYVTFTGRAPDEDLFEVLSSMDIGVNPDRVNAMNDKSTMNKILEYMAFGKPIVQFDVKEGRFSAQDSSLYAKSNDPLDLGDKILELIDAPDLRAKMGQRGRLRLETALSWEHQRPALLDAYCTALNIARFG